METTQFSVTLIVAATDKHAANTTVSRMPQDAITFARERQFVAGPDTWATSAAGRSCILLAREKLARYLRIYESLQPLEEVHPS